tara:strand:- start:732 stop:884 length:153 start_codon:yes stop_codon:yes gene_type:complete
MSMDSRLPVAQNHGTDDQLIWELRLAAGSIIRRISGVASAKEITLACGHA